MQVNEMRKSFSAARAGSILAVGALCGTAGVTGGAIGGEPAGAAVGATGGGPAPEQCSVKKLEGPNGATSSEVTAGSSDGTDHVGYAHVDGKRQATWWASGETSDLLPDFKQASANGVSERIVVGTGIKEGEDERSSYLYYDGETRELEAPKGERATATDINSEGESVGYGSDGSALRWSLDAEDEPKKLSSPHGDAQALSIDDDGAIGGSADGEEAGTVPVVWSSGGAFTQLPELDGAEHGVVSSVSGDYAIGTSGPSPDASPDVQWNLAEDTVTKLPNSLDEANDVNDSGDVAATTDDGHAAVFEDGEVTELPHLAGGSSKAEVISDAGEVAGSSQDAAGSWHAVVWTGC